jgi:hypothetical protein
MKGLILPLNHPEIPDKWIPADDFSSHRPMLYRAIMNIRHTAFCEFGSGAGSTPLLREFYASLPAYELHTFENDHLFYDLRINECNTKILYKTSTLIDGNHYLTHSPDLIDCSIPEDALVFIDSAPADQRSALIKKHSSEFRTIIVHDTEPGSDYIYKLQFVLSGFLFRCDLLVKGYPQTTIISNQYDFREWKTVVNDQIRFV